MEPEIKNDEEITTNGHGAEIAAVFFASIICAATAYFFGFNHALLVKINSAIQVNQLTKNQTQVIDPFATVTLSAHSAYVFDIKNNKVIYAKNPNDILPLASITKIMTAVVATQSLSPNATISINKSALGKEGDSGLFINERWNFSKLLDYTLAVSSNDGAAAVAQTVGPDFVDKMNQKAKSLDLNSMNFFNETGLDESATTSGGYSSAADLAKLLSYIIKNSPELLAATTYSKFTVTSLDNIKHVAINTDSDVDKIPGIIASKTGYTDLAGGNLAIVYDASVNYPIIAIVLGSTYDGRFTDISELVSATNQTLSLQK